MAFNTAGLSWLTPTAAALVRDFRETSERLGFKGSVHPSTWKEIEREHIRASAALCHLIADHERGRRDKTRSIKKDRSGVRRR